MNENIKKLAKKKITANTSCHPDPNISNYFNESIFTGSVGQVGRSQTHLQNNGIYVGDLFIFFGWFIKKNEIELSKGSHVLFGYLQVGEIIKPQQLSEKERANYEKKYPWLKNQPHWEIDKYKDTKNNTIYVASEKCSFDKTLNGWGVFKYNQALELTHAGAKTKSQWNLPNELKGLEITYNKNADKGDYFQSSGRGQEFVIEESPQAEKWAINLIKTHSK